MGSGSSHVNSLKRSDSISGIYSGIDDDGQVLSSYQKVVLRAAWRLMSSKSSQSSCGRTILKRLTMKDKSLKTIFQHFSVLGNVFQSTRAISTTCDYDKHAVAFVELLDFVMANLDRPLMIADRCEEIGRAHRCVKIFGMKTDHLDLVGESITETVREYQGWRRHRQAVGATNVIISFVIDRIRNGFLQRLEIPASVRTPQPSIDVDSDSATSFKRACSICKKDRSRTSVKQTKNKCPVNEHQENEISKKWKLAAADAVNNNTVQKTRPSSNKRLLPVPPDNRAIQRIKAQHQ